MDKLIENFRKISQQSLARQLGLLLGLAMSVAIGVGIILWSQTEEYSVLFSDLDGKDAAQVMEALDRLNVQYKLDERTGLISVPSREKYELRLKLAGEGLPAGGTKGFDILYEDQKFGVSSFLETARYNRALEEELANSVATLESVRGARRSPGNQAHQ